MSKTKITNNKIILSGHANTQEECETITLLANALEQSKDFQTVKYESGYAEFEKVGKTENLKFIPAFGDLTIVWDSNIISVSCNDMGNGINWTISGELQRTGSEDGQSYIFTVSLKEGYALDTVTDDLDSDSGYLSGHTDNTFTIIAGVGGIGGTITLTSRKAVVEPTYSFKRYYKNSSLDGSGTYKFRRYSVEKPQAPVEPTTFTFTVISDSNRHEYTAENGMTWNEWISSSYNTNGFYTSDNKIYNAGGLLLCNDAGTDYTSPSEIIVPSKTYTLIKVTQPDTPTLSAIPDSIRFVKAETTTGEELSDFRLNIYTQDEMVGQANEVALSTMEHFDNFIKTPDVLSFTDYFDETWKSRVTQLLEESGLSLSNVDISEVFGHSCYTTYIESVGYEETYGNVNVIFDVIEPIWAETPYKFIATVFYGSGEIGEDGPPVGEWYPLIGELALDYGDTAIRAEMTQEELLKLKDSYQGQAPMLIFYIKDPKVNN